ncbi:unnamed protein product [Oikopleura dioica]|uniref:DJ-1/PfpI domain-containing protein n=1 Tax=Oikopleura dioica TaxID=34765 RepID=E4XRP1_OIKDI|nr:unnamed protein product [Oikopleura dioica]
MASHRVAVLLAGSGVYDGSEVHEASAALVALSRHNAQISCFAPDKPQLHAINHCAGAPHEETRNVLQESARIARGKVTDLKELNVEDFDALLVPGGFSAAKNLSDWALKGQIFCDHSVKRLFMILYILLLSLTDPASNRIRAFNFIILLLFFMDLSVFLSARNQLIPKSDKDKNGKYDSLLAPAHCKRILRNFGYKDYVMLLLKDGFKRKYERDPNSLSEIARIFKEREEIKDQTATPKFKATFQEELDDPSDVIVGSEWIISDVAINGQPSVSDYHRRNEFMKTPYVYKICRSKPRVTRSSGIQLRQLHLKASNHKDAEILLLEPFFIKGGYNEDFINTIEVYNLLDPKAAPMTIERESYNNIIHFPRIEMSGKNLYENDNRVNGQLSESVLFLLVYYSSITTVCLECVEIKPSSINTLWIKRIENRDSHFDEELFWIDRMNKLAEVK